MAEDRTDPSTRLERQFESNLDSVDDAEALVLDTARKMEFPEDDLHQIGMAVREAMVNAIVHGNKYNAAKKVKLEVEQEGSRLTVVITDEGQGFDTDHLPDPLAEENLLRQSGRGLLLMRAFVDDFELTKSERGTRVRLVKNR